MNATPIRAKKMLDKIITADITLFFDLDGTLIDTNFANFLAYKKAVLSVTKSDYNLSYNPEERFTRSILKVAVPNLSKTDYENIIRRKEEYYVDFLHEIILITATTAILLKYSKTNKAVLVSNCRLERAIITLKHFCLLDKFCHIFCSDSLNGKDQKINKFQYAISKLNVSPKLIIAFENEEIEIANAQKAGISMINPYYL